MSMTTFPKIIQPSKWMYYLRYRNFPLFWLRHLMTRPFPTENASLDELVAFGNRHRVRGFNSQCLRAYIFWRLHQMYGCTSFVETGTLYGYTSAFVQRVFKSPVFSCEINPTFQRINRANLFWLNQINLFRSDSVDFLKDVCHESKIGKNPMFYLDAHWYDYMPLPDELAAIADQCERGIILIDDFLVPQEPKFLYDEYPDIRIDLELVDTHLRSRRKDISVYLPNYEPGLDPTGPGIGYAIILMGQDQEPPGDTFPFDLLTKV